MHTISVTDDLTLEIWPAAGEGDRPLVRLRSAALERDAEAKPGQVIIYPAEIRRLVAALVDAAGVLAGWAAEERDG